MRAEALQAQKGAAILAAMVVVVMVASLAAAAVAWQSTHVQVQMAERGRVQAMWLLRGAMDWSRLLLRQDAQSASAVDHLSEPWAVPLQETKLTTFISADSGVHQVDASADMSEAFLAGAMEDMQAKINLAQLVQSGQKTAEENMVQRLFEVLNLPQGEYVRLWDALQRTTANAEQTRRLITPQRLQDLVWYGIAPSTVKALMPYAYWSEVHVGSKINLNTASAVVIQAASPGMRPAQAQALVQARKQQHFRDLEQAREVVPGVVLSADVFTVNSHSFMAQGWVRMDGIALSLQAQLQRNGTTVTVTDVDFEGVPFMAGQTRQ